MASGTLQSGVVAIALLGLALGSLPRVAAADGIQVEYADLPWMAIAVTGDPAAGGEPTETLDGISRLQIVADGTTYFIGAIDDAFVLFRWTPDAGVVRVYPDAVGEAIAGTDPALVQRRITDERDLQYAVAANGSLLLSVGAATEFCAAGFALLAGDGVGPLALVAQSGEPVPAIGAGWRLDGRLSGSPSGLRPATWGDDAILFHASASADPCGLDPHPSSGTAIFAKGSDGTIHVVAAEGAPAVGIPGAFFESDLAVSNEQAGAALLTARVRLGPSGPLANAYYRWSAMSGLELLARDGQAAPSGGVLRLLESVALADDGSVYFVDQQFGSPGAVYRIDPQKVAHEIARIGGLPPGEPEGSTFYDFSSVAFSANGAGVFGGSIQTPSSGPSGIWTVSPDGSVANRLLDDGSPPLSYFPFAIGRGGRVLYETYFGVSVTDAPGSASFLFGWAHDFEFIQGMPEPAFPSEVAHDPSVIQLAIVASTHFEERSGLFVARLPEPRAGAIVALACLVALRPRRAPR